MWGWHMGDGWSWWLMLPMMFGFWIVVIWLIASISRNQHHAPGNGNHRSDPHEIAAKRYASGEISDEEYSKISERLQKHAHKR